MASQQFQHLLLGVVVAELQPDHVVVPFVDGPIRLHQRQ